MEKLIDWVGKHKVLAIIGGAGLLVVLYLMFRGGSAPQESGGTSALTAYYAASAAASGDAAQVSQSTNALAAATNQTNAARDVALAQIAEQSKVTTLGLNQAAYRDYLTEQAMSGTAASKNVITSGTNFTVGGQSVAIPGSDIWVEATNGVGAKTLWQGVAGVPSSLILVNPQTGEMSFNNEVPGTWSWIENYKPARLVTWSGTPGEVAQAYTPPAPRTTMTFAQFMSSLQG